MLLTTAAALAPRIAAAEAPPPPVFAEFGERQPDRTACDQAIDKGADFLVSPVVAAKDGTLFVAPGNELSTLTDIARRPEFADRRKDKTVDGQAVSGWFTEYFNPAELKTLAIAPAPRGGGRTPLPLLTLQEVIDIARAGSVRQARVVGISPRLVHPDYFAGLELNLEPRLADLIRLAGYNSRAAAMIVQGREPAALKTLAGLCGVRLTQLIDAEGGPADAKAMRYAAMISADGLTAVKTWASAVGPAEALLIQPGAKGAILATALAKAAHDAGLAVYARAAPPGPHEPYGAPRARLTALFLAGADGVMCADVGLAVKARGEAMSRRRGGG
ncbi:MAG: glycerophosphodiester phosphodiesterase [Caulobacteraceae bacterium]